MRLYVLPALLVAFATTASAQTMIVRPNIPVATQPSVSQVRVSVGVNLFIPAPNATTDQAAKAEEDGRRAVYEVAAHECTVLRDVLANDCRLDAINVNVQHMPAGQNWGQEKVEGYNVNGNVTFLITPK